MKKRRVLIANRGEIAVRIIKTLEKLEIESVLVCSEADIQSPAAKMAGRYVYIGENEAVNSYLKTDRIIQAAIDYNCVAIHPGYGFLSENKQFAEDVIKAGLIFVGPEPDTIFRMGDKVEARRIMKSSGVPVVPGFDKPDATTEEYSRAADEIGYPVLVKAKAGGGGKGMRLVQNSSELPQAIESARREAQSAFADAGIFIEKFVQKPRHIEVQVFGDGKNFVHMFERECSVQRRHQKIIEESPSPALNEQKRKQICDAAVEAARACMYKGAGTVEFIYSDETQEFFFLEMNTRLQVEHPVTEMVTGLDLVEWQLEVAFNGKLPVTDQSRIRTKGHSVEVRLYAEDPQNRFMPSVGKIHKFIVNDEQLRIDAGVESGSEITVYYDPMVAKLIAHGENRTEAIDRMITGLKSVVWFGPVTNLPFLIDVLDCADFRSGSYTTGLIGQNFSDWVVASGTGAAQALAAAFYYYGGPALTDSSQDSFDVFRKKDSFQLWT